MGSLGNTGSARFSESSIVNAQSEESNRRNEERERVWTAVLMRPVTNKNSLENHSTRIVVTPQLQVIFAYGGRRIAPPETTPALRKYPGRIFGPKRAHENPADFSSTL
jgi:hypothetical protein